MVAGMSDAEPCRRAKGSFRLLVIPLGETPRPEIENAVARHFPGASLDWLDRDDLRRRPLETVTSVLRCHYAAAVLVATDLRQPRLRLTSLVLSLPRARKRWRIDLRGNREAFSLGQHLAHNGFPVARHLVACWLAFVLAEPALRVIDWFIPPRRPLLGRPSRILYLRSQLRLGLEG